MRAVAIEESWKKALMPVWEEPFMDGLRAFLEEERRSGRVFYPPPALIFHAFDACPLPCVKVVLLGQDPYHGPGQAHGLAFSAPMDMPVPASLRNVFIELESDLGIKAPTHPSLEGWGKQGVLLLNTTLSVGAGRPGSHKNKGWEQFTDHVIRTVNKTCSACVFLLWGRHAQTKASLIDSDRHMILQAAHPSPYSASGFFGCRHFSRANAWLETHARKPIDWTATL